MSFGICIVPVTVAFVLLLSLGAVLSGGSLPELHLSTCFFPGATEIRWFPWPQHVASNSGQRAGGGGRAGGLLPAALCLRRSRYLHSSVHVCLCFAGVVSGMLWNAGNIASIYAVQPPLGFAVGYPVTQVCGLLLRCGYTLLVVHASLYYH